MLILLRRALTPLTPYAHRQLDEQREHRQGDQGLM